MTMIRNNDGPTLAPNTAEESRYSAHLNQGTPIATTQVASSTAPPPYAAELCQQPLFGFQGVFRAYSSACACASAVGIGADAPAYVSLHYNHQFSVEILTSSDQSLHEEHTKNSIALQDPCRTSRKEQNGILSEYQDRHTPSTRW